MLCYGSNTVVPCLSTHKKAASLPSIGSTNNTSCDFGILIFPWGKGVISREGGSVALFFWWLYFSGVLPTSANT